MRAGVYPRRPPAAGLTRRAAASAGACGPSGPGGGPWTCYVFERPRVTPGRIFVMRGQALTAEPTVSTAEDR